MRRRRAALALVNVGDSRTYVMRGGRLRRVTIDHSYVQELVSTGHITETEARSHPRRNIVTRALGIEPHRACRHLGAAVRARRPLRAVQRRPGRRGRRRRDRRHRSAANRSPQAAAEALVAAGQRARRPRQRHRRGGRRARGRRPHRSTTTSTSTSRWDDVDRTTGSSTPRPARRRCAVGIPPRDPPRPVAGHRRAAGGRADVGRAAGRRFGLAGCCSASRLGVIVTLTVALVLVVRQQRQHRRPPPTTVVRPRRCVHHHAPPRVTTTTTASTTTT